MQLQLSTDEQTDYSYDQNNNLIKVVKPNNDAIEFIYDANGRRVEKKVNNVSTYYQYDANGNIVSETDSSQNIKVKYIRDTSGKTLAMEQNNQMYHFLYNAHGDVTGLTDSSGNVVASYSYDEFGNLTSSTGSIYNPLRYSGANNAYYDSETSLYKMGVRYYNSEIGRWTSKDSYKGEFERPQTQNNYVYAENSPIINADPSGNWSKRVIFPHGKADDSPLLKDILRVDAQWAYEHKGLNFISKIIWFVGIVGDNKSWDFKKAKDSWGKTKNYNMHFMTFRTNPKSKFKKISPERFGNIHYGYVGNAIGYSLVTLWDGSSAVDFKNNGFNNLMNEWRDKVDIQFGYNLYSSLGRRNPSNGFNLYRQQP